MASSADIITSPTDKTHTKEANMVAFFKDLADKMSILRQDRVTDQELDIGEEAAQLLGDCASAWNTTHPQALTEYAHFDTPYTISLYRGKSTDYLEQLGRHREPLNTLWAFCFSIVSGICRYFGPCDLDLWSAAQGQKSQVCPYGHGLDVS